MTWEWKIGDPVDDANGGTMDAQNWHGDYYFEEDNRPQVLEDVNYEGGMGVTIGRLREDNIFDFKFVGLSHNTLRGAAGGAVESAEMLTALGYIKAK